MAEVKLAPTKTYATRENARKAVEKNLPAELIAELRWVIIPNDEGRFYPLFIGEKPCHYGVHFHFCVIN
jgi:hypothetical protein